MDPDFQQSTLEQEDSHWWYRGRRRILERVIADLPLPAAAQILDAGCGGGGQLEPLSRRGQVVGLEPVPMAADVARRRGVADVVDGTLEQLPFTDGRFDLVTCLDVLEHLDDDRPGLEELLRVTRPGGWLVVTVPAYPRLWSRHDDLNEHRRRYTRPTLLRAASDAGWSPRRTTHFNSVLLPAAAAVRVLERLSHSGGSEIDRPGRLANRMLEVPLRVEAGAIARGRRLPAGLSLLAVLQAPQRPVSPELTAGQLRTTGLGGR